jgi:CheY-like chemotaxis protein
MLEGGLTGIDTILRIRSLLGYDIPGMVVTGDTTPDRIRDLQASGIALLHKPVGSAELRRAIATMVEASALVAAD